MKMATIERPTASKPGVAVGKIRPVRRFWKWTLWATVGVIVLGVLGAAYRFFRGNEQAPRDYELEALGMTSTFRRSGHLGINYFLFPPPDGPKTEAPLIVYLHGYDGSGREGVPLEVRHLVMAEAQRQLPAWILAPRVPLPYWWTGSSRETLSHIVHQVVKDHPIDTTRVYIMGFSLGAIGAVEMVREHPSDFAAIVPLSGRLNAGALEGIPTWHMIGELDDVFSPPASEKTMQELADRGADVRFTKVKDKAHGILEVLEDPDLRKWLFARTNEDPERFTSPDSP